MNDAAIMCIIQSHEKLASEFSHDEIRKHLVFEPYSEGVQCLPNQLEDKTDMAAIGTFLLKIIYEMANRFVARVCPVCLSKVRQDLSLVNRLLFIVAFGTQDFQGFVLVLTSISV